VRITHLPTGIVTWCQNERSQLQNKETAMKMLISKLIELKEREQMEEENRLKGDLKRIEWGSQIRSYVFCPYTLVKDHRTGYRHGVSLYLTKPVEPEILLKNIEIELNKLGGPYPKKNSTAALRKNMPKYR
jgi:protein subunit release factor A